MSSPFSKKVRNFQNNFQMLSKSAFFGAFSRICAGSVQEIRCHDPVFGIYLLRKTPHCRGGKQTMAQSRPARRKNERKIKMSNCLITFRSATYSMKAQLALSRAGIAARAVKLDPEYSGRGCTHGLRIDCRMRRRTESILRESGIPYSAVVGS